MLSINKIYYFSETKPNLEKSNGGRFSCFVKKINKKKTDGPDLFKTNKPRRSLG